jgi:hypothetical protein
MENRRAARNGGLTGLAARHGGRLGLAALVAVLLLGLGLRIGYAWDGRAPVYDAQAYAAIAANLADGDGFTLGEGATQPASNYSPGLPLFVAGIYELSGGTHERLARLGLAAIGSLAVLFAYLIGRRLTGRLRGGSGLGARAGRTRRLPKQPRQGASDAAREIDAAGAGAAAVVEVGSAAGNEPQPPSAVPALLGAAAVAVYPAFLEYGGMLMGEPLAATLLSGGVLAVLWAWDGESQAGEGHGDRPAGRTEPVDDPAGRGESVNEPEGRGEHRVGAGSMLRWLLAGGLFGALALVRPEYLGIALLLAAAIALRPRTSFVPHSGQKCVLSTGWMIWRRRLAAAGVMLLGVALVVVPWTVRNAVALDRFVPISTGGGQVLFAGTYLPSDGDPEAVGAEVVARNPDLFSPADADRLRLEQILARLAADRRPGEETDKALSQLGKEQLWDGITEDPVDYAGFVAGKAWRLWSHGPRDVMDKPLWEALHAALVLLGLLGLAILAAQRRWEALLLGTVLLAITALSALLVASPRRVLVLVPLLAALAATAGSWAWAGLASRGMSSFGAYGVKKSTLDPPEGADSLGRP